MEILSFLCPGSLGHRRIAIGVLYGRRVCYYAPAVSCAETTAPSPAPFGKSKLCHPVSSSGLWDGACAQLLVVVGSFFSSRRSSLFRRKLEESCNFDSGLSRFLRPSLHASLSAFKRERRKHSTTSGTDTDHVPRTVKS